MTPRLAGTPYASYCVNDLEEPVKHRSTTTVLAFAFLALAPVVASAQFTTFVAPPRKAAVDSAKALIAEGTARSDSVARLTLTDMKAWVDSAAGTSSNPQVAVADTSLPASQLPNPTPSTTAATPASETTTFSNGAIAPDTASLLPVLLASGGLLLLVGGLLLRLRPRKVKAG